MWTHSHLMMTCSDEEHTSKWEEMLQWMNKGNKVLFTVVFLALVSVSYSGLKVDRSVKEYWIEDVSIYCLLSCQLLSRENNPNDVSYRKKTTSRKNEMWSGHWLLISSTLTPLTSQGFWVWKASWTWDFACFPGFWRVFLVPKWISFHHTRMDCHCRKINWFNFLYECMFVLSSCYQTE